MKQFYDILSLLLIQEGQLSVTGERNIHVLSTCKLPLKEACSGSVARLIDRGRNDLKCVEGP